MKIYKLGFFKFTLIFVALFFTLEGQAQLENSLIVKIDSLEVDIYNNYDSDYPPVLVPQDFSTPKSNSFIVTIDSLSVDVYQNFESKKPPVDLHNLPEPILFILNGEELEIKNFSELDTWNMEVESIEIFQNAKEIRQLGYEKYKTLVWIITQK